MALTYVGGKTAATLGTTSNWSTVLTNLTGGTDSAPIAGDIVVITYAIVSASNAVQSPSNVVTAGYTKIAQVFVSDTYDSNLGVLYKIMGSSPDISVTLGSTSGTAQAGAVAIQVWRGVDAANPLDVNSTTAVAMGPFWPNPPAITPITSGAIILATGMGGHNQGTQTFAASGLSNFITAAANDTYDVTVGMGWFEWLSGAYDPSGWSAVSGTNTTSSSWAALTLALRPAADATTLTATNIATAAPAISTVSVAQSHSFAASSIGAAAPTVQAATIGQTHSLAAQGIATAAPTIASASVAQSHALATTRIATGQPTIGTAAISQVLELTATGIATAVPTVGASALTQVYALTATGVATAVPTVGASALTQVYALTATGIATAAPAIGTAEVRQTHWLVSTDLAAAAPTVGAADTRNLSIRRIATDHTSANFASGGIGPNRVDGFSGSNSITEF